MKAEGNHYEAGGKVKKMAGGGHALPDTSGNAARDSSKTSDDYAFTQLATKANNPIGGYARDKSIESDWGNKKLGVSDIVERANKAKTDAESWDDAPKKKRGGSVRRKK